MEFKTVLVAALAGCALVTFIGGIIWAVVLSFKKKPQNMPVYLNELVITINGILAANLGSVLGQHVAGVTAYQIAEGKGICDLSSAVQTQIVAVLLYLLILVGTLIVWAAKKFSEKPEEVVPIIPQLSKTFFGVAAGCLAIILGVDS